MSENVKPVIFVFAPHPDDETLACGGTIIKKIEMGYTVKIVVMTDGSHSHSTVLGIWSDPTPNELSLIRKEEIIQATSSLGVNPAQVIFLDQEDGFLFKNETQIIEEVKLILRNETSIIEVYMPHKIDQHKDHQATNKIVLRAMEELELNPKVYFYIIWADRDVQTQEKKISVDISNVLPKKREAILKYESQIGSISSSQDRPILEDSFLERFISDPLEHFWLQENYKNEVIDS